MFYDDLEMIMQIIYQNISWLASVFVSLNGPFETISHANNNYVNPYHAEIFLYKLWRS